MALEAQYVGKYVRANLGSSVLGDESVEWSNDLQTIVLDKVYRHYNRLIGLKEYAQLQTIDGVQRYPLHPLLTSGLPNDIDTSMGVVSVDFPIVSPGLTIDEFHIMEQSFAPQIDVPSFMANRYNLQQMRMAIGSDPVWRQQFETLTIPTTPTPTQQRVPVLYLSPPPRGTLVCALVYLQKINSIASVPPEWEQWSLDMALAESKIIVGGARRRFEADLRQDGTALVQEGQQERDKLIMQAERGGLVSGIVWNHA